MNRPLTTVLGHAVRALVYSALGVALLAVATLTAPAEAEERPTRPTRPATAEEERAYERQRLVDALDEYRRQHP